MERKILVYGNPDKTTYGFPDEDDVLEYIKAAVFRENGRYRYSQQKNADIIVFSRDGKAYGHFEIDRKEPPSEEDRAKYPPTRCVYIVSKSFLYEKPVLLSSFSITKIQFGKLIGEDVFRQIEDAAGSIQEYGYDGQQGKLTIGKLENVV